MTDIERKVLLMMADGHEPALNVLHSICLLPLIRKGDFFDECLKRGITGTKLVEVYKECECSPLKTLQFVLNKKDGLMARRLNMIDLATD